eukprot:scaffold1334_cov344-Prasinococcus_capsulatus_cf.AAC.20
MGLGGRRGAAAVRCCCRCLRQLRLPRAAARPLVRADGPPGAIPSSAARQPAGKMHGDHNHTSCRLTRRHGDAPACARAACVRPPPVDGPRGRRLGAVALGVPRTSTECLPGAASRGRRRSHCCCCYCCCCC